MPTPAMNIAIAQPRSRARRPLQKKLLHAGFVNKDSVMNSHFSINLFGSSQSSNRKQGVYTDADSVSTGDVKAKHGNDSTESKEDVPF